MESEGGKRNYAIEVFMKNLQHVDAYTMVVGYFLSQKIPVYKKLVEGNRQMEWTDRQTKINSHL